MDSERYLTGQRMLQQVDGKGGDAVVESLQDIAPDFAQYLIEFPFGDIYSRPGLDLRSREIATVAALTAMGNAAPQLKVHIAAARQHSTACSLQKRCLPPTEVKTKASGISAGLTSLRFHIFHTHAFELFIRQRISRFEIINDRIRDIVTAGCVTRFTFSKCRETITAVRQEAIGGNVINRGILNGFAV